MSEKLEIVKNAFAAWERGDMPAVLKLMDDALVTYRRDPDAATFHGKDGFFAALAEWTENFSDWSVRPEEFFDMAERVMVRVHQSARGEMSGVTVEEDFWFVFELRGERISKVSFYTRRSDALEAAELSE